MVRKDSIERFVAHKEDFVVYESEEEARASQQARAQTKSDDKEQQKGKAK